MHIWNSILDVGTYRIVKQRMVSRRFCVFARTFAAGIHKVCR